MYLFLSILGSGWKMAQPFSGSSVPLSKERWTGNISHWSGTSSERNHELAFIFSWVIFSPGLWKQGHWFSLPHPRETSSLQINVPSGLVFPLLCNLVISHSPAKVHVCSRACFISCHSDTSGAKPTLTLLSLAYPSTVPVTPVVLMGHT